MDERNKNNSVKNSSNSIKANHFNWEEAYKKEIILGNVSNIASVHEELNECKEEFYNKIKCQNKFDQNSKNIVQLNVPDQMKGLRGNSFFNERRAKISECIVNFLTRKKRIKTKLLHGVKITKPPSLNKDSKMNKSDSKIIKDKFDSVSAFCSALIKKYRYETLINNGIKINSNIDLKNFFERNGYSEDQFEFDAKEWLFEHYSNIIGEKLPEIQEECILDLIGRFKDYQIDGYRNDDFLNVLDYMLEFKKLGQEINPENKGYMDSLILKLESCKIDNDYKKIIGKDKRLMEYINYKVTQLVANGRRSLTDPPTIFINNNNIL